jgi:beta-galactosidase/beta-glucuronidase
VWQDFMFGCGNYPAFATFLQSVHNECVANVGRLRHHPSIVIYAGNNEDYQVQEQFGLTYNYEDKDPESWLQTNFPARYIYEKVSACVALPFHLSASYVGITAPARSRRDRIPACTLPSGKPVGRWLEDIQYDSWRHASMER